MNWNSNWDDNPYYNPEKCGLSLIGSVDDEDASYSFDMVAVWRGPDGNIYAGQDSGCSCPAPFEDVKGLDDLELIERSTQLDRYFTDGTRRDPLAVAALVRKVGEALRKARKTA